MINRKPTKGGRGHRGDRIGDRGAARRSDADRLAGGSGHPGGAAAGPSSAQQAGRFAGHRGRRRLGNGHSRRACAAAARGPCRVGGKHRKPAVRGAGPALRHRRSARRHPRIPRRHRRVHRQHRNRRERNPGRRRGRGAGPRPDLARICRPRRRAAGAGAGSRAECRARARGGSHPRTSRKRRTRPDQPLASRCGHRRLCRSPAEP